MATNEQAQAKGFATPTGTDPIRGGDDAIAQNARAAVELFQAYQAYVNDLSGIETPDAAVALLAEDENSAFRQAFDPVLSATIEAGIATDPDLQNRLAAKYDRPRIVGVRAVGDSIEQDPSGYLPTLAAVSGQRIRMDGIDGIGGQNTTQILARVPAAITAALAGGSTVVLMGGATNDHSQAVPEATTRANFQTALGLVRDAGLEFVVRNCPPADVAGSTAPWNTLAARRVAIQRHNAWMAAWCGANSVPLIDLYEATVEPTTGGYKAGYTTDSVHPNTSGALQAARYMAPRLPPLFADAPPQRLAPVGVVGENLLTNGHFVGDTDANGLANVWKGGGSFTTKSLDTTDTAIKGNWQRLSGTGLATIYDDLSAATPGRVYEFSGLAAVVAGQLTLRMSFRDNGGALIGATYYYAAQSFGALVAKSDRATFRCTGTCPVGATKVQIEVLSNNGTSDLHVAQFMIRDLTDLGIA